MKCNICDKDLNDKEIAFNKDIGAFEPCGECLDIALDAAFSDGFHKPDEDDDKYIIISDEETSAYESAMNTMYGLFTRKDKEE